MSNVEQFEKAVTDAGAVAMRVMRQPNGSERLVIQTPGGVPDAVASIPAPTNPNIEGPRRLRLLMTKNFPGVAVASHCVA